jgi:hypothetical protein
MWTRKSGVTILGFSSASLFDRSNKFIELINVAVRIDGTIYLLQYSSNQVYTTILFRSLQVPGYVILFNAGICRLRCLFSVLHWNAILHY